MASDTNDEGSVHTPQSSCEDQYLDLKPPVFPEGIIPADKRTRNRSREIRICTVCGDKALGYNFDAISCESCKAFFRRNALKPKFTKCMFKGNCTIDPNTRRFCSACRIAKCFSAGMKKHMILDEQEKRKRIEKVEENRKKRLAHLQKHSGVPFSGDILNDSADSIPLANGIASLSPEMQSAEIQQAMKNWSESTLLAQLEIPAGANSCGDEPISGESQPLDRRVLTSVELATLQNLETQFANSFGSNEEEPLSPEGLNMEALINHIGIVCKLLIKFAKKLPDFTSLPQPTQVTLLKANLLDCVAWRSANFWDPDREGWVNQTGLIPPSILSIPFEPQHPLIKEEHVDLITKIKRLVGHDMKAFAVICSMSLLSPLALPDAEKQLAADIHDKYVMLLKHYLESREPWSSANRKFLHLMYLDDSLRAVMAEHSKAFRSCDAQQVEPLLLEVLNITPSGDLLRTNSNETPH